MFRRAVTYLSFLACAFMMGVSQRVAGDDSAQPQQPELMNLDPVACNYASEEHREVMDSASNVIHDDAGSLVPFMDKLQALRNGADEMVSIVHVGDSHIQGGFFDARFRELMQEAFGDAGRGLIVPHRLSGSNEARDYAIRTKDKLVSGRCTDRDLAEKLSFTGVAVGLEAVEPGFTIWSKSPFSSVTVLHHPAAPALNEPDSLAIGSYCTMSNTQKSTRINFLHDVDSVFLQGRISAEFNNPTFYGFSLENGNPGVLVHAVSANGAAFEHFERNTDFTEGGAADLSPDLIIISLGTNNCFGSNYRSHEFRDIAERFVIDVRKNYPDAALLLTTPMEGCRRTSVSRRTYGVNKNLASVAEVLEDVARENGIACWNLYEAAGGEGANAVWHSRKLVQGDRLHLTEDGYTLQGDMLFDAVARYYNRLVCPQEGIDSEAILSAGLIPAYYMSKSIFPGYEYPCFSMPAIHVPDGDVVWGRGVRRIPMPDDDKC